MHDSAFARAQIHHRRGAKCLLKIQKFVLLTLLGAGNCSAVEQLTNAWSLSIQSSSESSPAIAPDGTIYFGTFVGMLYAVRPDGSIKWTFRAGLEIKSCPAVGANGIIYFGSRDRKVYAIRPDGKKLWAFPTGAWVDSSPALAADGMICFGSWDKSFYALNADGTKRWQFQTDGPIVSSPAIGLDGAIYFGSHDKKFYALSSDGKKKWEYSTAGPIVSSPALDPAEGIYFTSVDGGCCALNFDGTLRWRLRTGGITESSPVLGPDGTVYVGVNKQLWAITARGDKKWDRNVEDLIIPTPMVLADSSICFESGWGVLLNIGPDMTFNWFFSGIGRAAPAVSAGGTIYVSNSTHFYAINGTTPLARTAWPKFRGNSRNTGNVNDAPR